MGVDVVLDVPRGVVVEARWLGRRATCERFRVVLGRPPDATAAPGCVTWRVSPAEVAAAADGFARDAADAVPGWTAAFADPRFVGWIEASE